jgi:hypothetical protein
MDYLNTHFYDRQISELVARFRDALTKSSQVVKVEKMFVFKQYFSTLTSPYAKHSLAVILNCFEHGYSGNHDQINNLIATDILYILLKNLDTSEYSILEEQLADMTSGLCSQGRTIRLFQLLVAYVDLTADLKIESDIEILDSSLVTAH